MKKTKLFTILATVIVGVSATSCALPDVLYRSVEGHVHILVHYYNANHHWDECTECGERLNVEDHIYGEITHTDTTHSGSCTVCGYTLTESHSFAYLNLGEEGHSAYCDFCGYFIVEEHDVKYSATTETVYDDENDTYTEEEGHRLTCACGYGVGEFEKHYSDGGYSSDFKEHYKTCEVCGSIYDREAHSHENIDDYISFTIGTYSDIDETGYYGYCDITYSCDVCGESYVVSYGLDEDQLNEIIDSL